MSLETMLIVNTGINGMNRSWQHPDGMREEKHFPINIPVSCSIEMGEYLLRKYCDPQMTIYFRRADGEALNMQPIKRLEIPNIDELDAQIDGYMPEIPTKQTPSILQKRKYTRRK